MAKPLNSISLIDLPHHFEDNGDLIVIEGNKHIPFSIARVFVVRAPKNEIRGQHAHKQCTQFLICHSGSIEVICDDGENITNYLLDRPNFGLMIPPGIWAQQTYLTDNSVLTVLCDRPYEAEDYIRQYDEFKTYYQKNSKD
jgi:dTDP-4-dehydrorhamnose 3,5-epimerase-like enzyme